MRQNANALTYASIFNHQGDTTGDAGRTKANLQKNLFQSLHYFFNGAVKLWITAVYFVFKSVDDLYVGLYAVELDIFSIQRVTTPRGQAHKRAIYQTPTARKYDPMICFVAYDLPKL